MARRRPDGSLRVYGRVSVEGAEQGPCQGEPEGDNVLLAKRLRFSMRVAAAPGSARFCYQR